MFFLQLEAHDDWQGGTKAKAKAIAKTAALCTLLFHQEGLQIFSFFFFFLLLNTCVFHIFFAAILNFFQKLYLVTGEPRLSPGVEVASRGINPGNPTQYWSKKDIVQNSVIMSSKSVYIYIYIFFLQMAVVVFDNILIKQIALRHFLNWHFT